jgi:hypothetical protein
MELMRETITREREREMLKGYGGVRNVTSPSTR